MGCPYRYNCDDTDFTYSSRPSNVRLLPCSFHQLRTELYTNGFSSRPAQSRHLPSLPLVRLVVLEREPTCSLVRTCLPANPAIAAREQNAPESNRSEEGRA
jgi:hypothetical protein